MLKFAIVGLTTDGFPIVVLGPFDGVDEAQEHLQEVHPEAPEELTFIVPMMDPTDPILSLAAKIAAGAKDDEDLRRIAEELGDEL